jgi:hypothetical protein
MCYSPEVDLIAGVVVGAVGVDALRHVDDRRYLPLAAVPLLLAAHQLIEAVAWWGLQGRVSPTAGDVAVVVYLAIALGVVPIVVPYAVMRSEPITNRQAWMLPFVVLGVGVSAILLFGMVTGGYTASIADRYIAYGITAPEGALIGGLYVLAVCTPLLMSSQRRLVIFGLVNVPVVLLLSVLLSGGLISLWCGWAAVASLVVARHIREVGSTRSFTHPRAFATD